MRVAFVNNTEKWGGVKTWSLSMARSFLDDGHDALVYGSDPVFLEKARSMGLEALQPPRGPDYNPLAIAFYMAQFRQRRIEHVVVNVGRDMRTAGVAARMKGICVVHRVGAPGDFRSTPQTRLDAFFVRPRYLCCSEFVCQQLQIRAPHVRAYESRSIHPGVPVPPLPSRPLPERPYRLIATSRLAGDKRHADVLEALAVLKKEGLPFHLTIVGDGPLRGELESLVHRRGLEKRVRFIGFTTDVGAYLREAHIFVLPTLAEPLGIALEEAMALGLAPLARRAGGVPEIWPGFCPELLVDPGPGPDAFTTALRGLLAYEPERLRELGTRVHEHAAACFSQSRQYAAFRDWLAAGGSGSSSRCCACEGKNPRLRREH